METKDKILNKIKKLLNKADSAKDNGSIQEAEIFALKAQELLTQYNLELSDLPEDKKQEIIFIKINLKEKFNIAKTEGTWITDLMSTIARYNFGKMLIMGNKGDHKVILFAEPQNIELIEFIHEQILNKVKQLAKKAWSEYTGTDKKNAFLRGYKQGIVIGITTKLEEQRSNQMNQYEGMPGLVLSNNRSLEEAVNKSFIVKRSSKSRSLSSIEGRMNGITDGRKLDINKGLTTNYNNNNKYLTHN